jgi:hypothetical protein
VLAPNKEAAQADVEKLSKVPEVSSVKTIENFKLVRRPARSGVKSDACVARSGVRRGAKVAGSDVWCGAKVARSDVR